MTVITATPRLEPEKNVGRIGVELEDRVDFEVVRPGPTLEAQFSEVAQMLGDTFYAVFHYNRTGVGISSFSGPVGIAGGWWYEIRSGGITRGLKFAVLINLALAVFNILPIPVLDGGHIFFAVYELVFRHPLPARFVHAVSTAFAVLLISFMLYITVFDFKRFFGFRFNSSEKPVQTNESVPRNPAMNYCANPFFWQRRVTREVKVGHVGVGGDNPIRVQTMLISDTMNTEACVKEAIPIIEAGCEILRITAPSINDAKNLKNIVAELRKRGYDTPIVADIHFVPAAALEAASGARRCASTPAITLTARSSPFGSTATTNTPRNSSGWRRRSRRWCSSARNSGRAMRIGTNHGSLSDRIMNRYGDTPLGMVESALEFVRICRKQNYHDIILSMKASNPKVMIEAYRLLVARMNEEGSDWNYPLHLGVTEAGEGEDGRIKSAIGIGALLEDGIGDTVRVSLTEDSVHEIPVCKELVKKYNALWEAETERRRRIWRHSATPVLLSVEKDAIRSPTRAARRPSTSSASCACAWERNIRRASKCPCRSTRDDRPDSTHHHGRTRHVCGDSPVPREDRWPTSAKLRR